MSGLSLKGARHSTSAGRPWSCESLAGAAPSAGHLTDETDNDPALEELSISAWPALQTMLYRGWVCRFADGYIRRANSVNPLYPMSGDLAENVATCERQYRDQGLPAVFKMTAASCPRELDAFLAAHGYATEAHTRVQLLDLCERTVPSGPSV